MYENHVIYENNLWFLKITSSGLCIFPVVHGNYLWYFKYYLCFVNAVYLVYEIHLRLIGISSSLPVTTGTKMIEV